MLAGKNFSLSPAAQALGLGDQVRQQLEDDLEERKKKAMMAVKAGGGAANALLGPMTMGSIGSAGY